MTGLIGVIQTVIKNYLDAVKLTDKATGTVVSVSPLTIKTDTSLPPISGEALILTSNVCKKTKAVRGGSGTVTVTEGLKVGDKVIMLRVQKGQQLIVLSKVMT